MGFIGVLQCRWYSG